MRLNKSIFRKLKKDYVGFDLQREKLIADSRIIIKLSKQVINSIHREDFASAKKFSADIEKSVESAIKKTKSQELKSSGLMRSALQEYVEAIGFYELVTKGTLPSATKLKVDAESYLLGMCDLTGELGRRAVHMATKKNIKAFKDIRNIINDIHTELLEFDFRNGELRRKYDSVKYTVKKMDELLFDLTMKIQ